MKKGKGGEKRESEKGEGAIYSPCPISLPKKKGKGEGGGDEKKREREKGEGAFPLSPSSPGLDSTPSTSDACRAGLLFRYGFLSFAGFTTDNF